MSNLTATQTRAELETIAIAHERLRKYPEHQAEAIAKHYAAHATLALHLLELLKVRRYGPADANIDHCIDLLVKQIKTNHLHDLGLQLEWENPIIIFPASNEIIRRPAHN